MISYMFPHATCDSRRVILRYSSAQPQPQPFPILDARWNCRGRAWARDKHRLLKRPVKCVFCGNQTWHWWSFNGDIMGITVGSSSWLLANKANKWKNEAWMGTCCEYNGYNIGYKGCFITKWWIPCSDQTWLAGKSQIKIEVYCLQQGK